MAAAVEFILDATYGMTVQCGGVLLHIYAHSPEESHHTCRYRVFQLLGALPGVFVLLGVACQSPCMHAQSLKVCIPLNSRLGLLDHGRHY